MKPVLLAGAEDTVSSDTALSEPVADEELDPDESVTQGCLKNTEFLI